MGNVERATSRITPPVIIGRIEPGCQHRVFVIDPDGNHIAFVPEDSRTPKDEQHGEVIDVVKTGEGIDENGEKVGIYSFNSEE